MAGFVRPFPFQEHPFHQTTKKPLQIGARFDFSRATAAFSRS